jgi:uncharacterized protein
MTSKKLSSLLIFTLYTLSTFWASAAMADRPLVGSTVPPLNLEKKGEITYDGEDFGFIPWRSSNSPGTVHVIQYFGATFGDRDTFAPFTDRIEASFEEGSFHVTTILNMDAALWGTSGIVTAELKKNKKKYPTSSLVVDKDGIGVDTWGLGKDGTGLIIVNSEGIIEFFSDKALTQAQLAPAIKLIGENITR